jgi:S-DNA-T family DNA segregation ATPase FtsK/SpoIIIE
MTFASKEVRIAMNVTPADDNDIFDDELYRQAVRVVREARKASTSLIQRQLNIGFNSASRLMDRMLIEGIVVRRE